MIRVSGSLDREQLLGEDEEVHVQVTVSEGSPILSHLTFDLSSLSTGSLTSSLWPLLCF